jgi:hypothetical protein
LARHLHALRLRYFDDETCRLEPCIGHHPPSGPTDTARLLGHGARRHIRD